MRQALGNAEIRTVSESCFRTPTPMARDPDPDDGVQAATPSSSDVARERVQHLSASVGTQEYVPQLCHNEKIAGAHGCPGDLVFSCNYSTDQGAGDRTRTGDVQLGKVTGLRVQTALYYGTRPEDVHTSPLQNGRSGLKNGVGGPLVDPAPSG